MDRIDAMSVFVAALDKQSLVGKSRRPVVQALLSAALPPSLMTVPGRHRLAANGGRTIRAAAFRTWRQDTRDRQVA